MFKKDSKLISILLCALIALGGLSAPCVTASADNKNESAAAYGLADKIEEGNILHCSNTYLSQIYDMLPQIARQGFSAVQISPVQGNKVSINSGAYFCDWTFYYQPTNFKVGNELGSADDLKKLCDKAHEYGIKVIVDIVSNHMAQGDEGSSGSRSDQIEEHYNKSEYFHTSRKDANNNSRNSQVNLNVGGLPDLDTSNKTVQGWVYDLLEQCVSLGADGFRFDTAKHIETPSDGDLASDFWTNTAVKIKNKYKDLYIYGEVVDLANTVGINAYTDLMNVTDAGCGISARRTVNKSSVAELSKTPGVYDDVRIPTGKGVVWVESHDEFLDGTTTMMSADVLVKTYAAIASRKDDPTLFFPRPAVNNMPGQLNWDCLIGQYTDTWLSAEIREVNLFKNAFIGKSEKLGAYQDKYYTVERGDEGVCIVNLSGNEVINLPVSIKDGSYKDQISGNMFTVSGGHITGKMAKSGVAVIYNKTEIPVITVTSNGDEIKSNGTAEFTDETVDVKISVKGADKCTYTLAGNGEEEFEGAEQLTFGKDIKAGTRIPLTVKAYYGDKCIQSEYFIDKKDLSEPHVIYFDAPAMAYYAKTEDNEYSAGVPYVFEKTADDKQISSFPGKAMAECDSKLYAHLYKLELDSKTAVIKFNDGVSADVAEDAHTLPPTESAFGDASLNENRIQGGYNVSCSMLWSKGKLVNVKSDGEPYEVCSDTIELKAEVIDEPTDSEKSIITVKEPVITKYLYADVNLDGVINMNDITLMQKYIAKLAELDVSAIKAADVDGKEGITLEDVVLVQKFIAKLIDAFPSFNTFEVVTYVEYTTETDSLPSDTEVASDDVSDSDTATESESDSTDSEKPLTGNILYFKNTCGWEEVYAHFWEDQGSEATSWPGVEMISVGDNVYGVSIPDDIPVNRIIFNDGGSGNQTENLTIGEYGKTFVPNGNTGTDNFGNTLVFGKWE